MGRGSSATGRAETPRQRDPGTRVTREASERRQIDSRKVKLALTEWNDTTDISVDVYLEDPAAGGVMILLTGWGSLDDVPTDDGLRVMIADYLADPNAPSYAAFNGPTL